MTTKTIKQSNQEWLDHCAEMNRLHDAKAAELVADGWTMSGSRQQPHFTKDGRTVRLCRPLGSPIWTIADILL